MTVSGQDPDLSGSGTEVDLASDCVGPTERRAFLTDGFLILRGFYDIGQDIDPLRRGIHEIIGLVAERAGVRLVRGSYAPESFDDGYLALKTADRSLASIVYDAVKQLAPFVQLTASRRNAAVFRQLRGCNLVGVAGGGSGIRIDNPDETEYLAWWHQEYPAQGRSLDGIVFWSPLREVTSALGPVEILRGSQVEGLIPVRRDGGGSSRQGAYALRLNDEEVALRYPAVAPTASPGDLVLIDFLTVHRSGVNRSTESRWTMQMRYFNFAETTGRAIGWAGSFAAGNVLPDIHPGLEVGS